MVANQIVDCHAVDPVERTFDPRQRMAVLINQARQIAGDRR